MEVDETDVTRGRKPHMNLDKDLGRDPMPDETTENLEELGMHMYLANEAVEPRGVAPGPGRRRG